MQSLIDSGNYVARVHTPPISTKELRHRGDTSSLLFSVEKFVNPPSTCYDHSATGSPVKWTNEWIYRWIEDKTIGTDIPWPNIIDGSPQSP